MEVDSLPAVHIYRWIAMLVLWVMGLISAVNGQMEPLPVADELYQKWFGTAFD